MSNRPKAVSRVGVLYLVDRRHKYTGLGQAWEDAGKVSPKISEEPIGDGMIECVGGYGTVDRGEGSDLGGILQEGSG